MLLVTQIVIITTKSAASDNKVYITSLASKVFMIPTLSSLVAPEGFVAMKQVSVPPVNEDKAGIINARNGQGA